MDFYLTTSAGTFPCFQITLKTALLTVLIFFKGNNSFGSFVSDLILCPISSLSNHTCVTTKATRSRPKEATDYEKGHKDLCKNSWQDSYTKLHQHLIKTNQKFLIYTCRFGGWGNRVDKIMEYFNFALIAKRALLINCDQPSPLDDYLLPRNIKWNYKVNRRRQISVRHEAKIFLDNITDPSDPKAFDQFLSYGAEYNPNLVGNSRRRWAGHPVKYDLSVWPNLRQMMGCNFYYLFKKSDMMQQRLDEWKEKLGFYENIVIGIHIREGDVVFDSENKDKRFRNEEDIEFSFICAEQIQEKIEKRYNTDKVIWFLAADSVKRKAKVKQKYGSKVRFITGPVAHVIRPIKGKKDSGHLSVFLDFFLLQEADYRLYTTPSTFDKAIDMITLGTNHSSRTLEGGEPHCVMPPSLKD